MSLNGLRIGGQYSSGPLTTMDKSKLGLGCFSIFAGPIILIVWLVFW
jgi:hypothetical protein